MVYLSCGMGSSFQPPVRLRDLLRESINDEAPDDLYSNGARDCEPDEELEK